MMIEKLLTILISAIFQSLASVYILSKEDGNLRKRQKILFFICICILDTCNGLFIPNELRFIFCTIVVSFILYFILNIRQKYVISYSFVIILMLSISELIVSIVLVFFGIKSSDLINNIFYNMLANIIISMVTILLIKIPYISHIINKFNNFVKKKTSIIYYLCGFLVVLYLLTLKNGLEFLLSANYYINVIIMVVITIIIIVIMKNEFRYDQVNEENKQMLNYVTKYEKIITDQGKSNHEFKNQLMVIKGYAQMGNQEKLKEYLDSIIEDTKKTHSSYLISQLNKFPDGGIKGLLYYKLSLMDDQKIVYEINVEPGVKLKLKTLNTIMYKNITKILGVILDNAIDASKKCKNKNIIIDVTKEKNNVIFSFSNTYKGKIDIKKIGTGYTTKGKNHGYGLKLVNDIVNCNKDLEINRFISEEYFTTQLVINIKTKKKK